MKNAILIILLTLSASFFAVNAEKNSKQQNRTEQAEAGYKETFRQILEGFSRKYYNLCFSGDYVDKSVLITKVDSTLIL